MVTEWARRRTLRVRRGTLEARVVLGERRPAVILTCRCLFGQPERLAQDQWAVESPGTTVRHSQHHDVPQQTQCTELQPPAFSTRAPQPTPGQGLRTDRGAARSNRDNGIVCSHQSLAPRRSAEEGPVR